MTKKKLMKVLMRVKPSFPQLLDLRFIFALILKADFMDCLYMSIHTIEVHHPVLSPGDGEVMNLYVSGFWGALKSGGNLVILQYKWYNKY
jgi:hypothetical protein